MVLDIQREMIDQERSLDQTAAGQQLQKHLLEERKKTREAFGRGTRSALLGNMRGTSATNYLVISSFDDPLLLLAGRYKLDPATMMSADDFKYQAQLLKQKFFSELILAAFPKAATNSDSLEISITKVAPRLVVNFNVAIVICILYLVLGIAAGGVLYTSSPQTRPLDLSYDPNILSTSALAVQGDSCLKSLEGLDYSTMDQVTKSLQSSTVFLDHGELGIIRRRESSLIHSPPAKRRGRDIFG
jgi:hypothetical protein